jgi:RNA polymerase-binding protein DksA
LKPIAPHFLTVIFGRYFYESDFSIGTFFVMPGGLREQPNDARRTRNGSGAASGNEGIAAHAGAVMMDLPDAPMLDELRRELLRQKNQLCARPLVEATEQFADEIDRAAHLSQHCAETSLKNQARNQLNKIDVALARMNRGRYGICAHCDDPIGIRRLWANPAAIYCLSCQKRLFWRYDNKPRNIGNS